MNKDILRIFFYILFMEYDQIFLFWSIKKQFIYINITLRNKIIATKFFIFRNFAIFQMRITRSIFIVSRRFLFHYVGNYLYFKKNLMRN